MGWDSREAIAYDVAKESIIRHAKNLKNLSIYPLILEELELLKRPIEERINELGARQLFCPISNAPMSTEFAISRFCVPFLTKGWALFVDSDIVLKTDIAELFALADNKYAVMVVKHKQEVGSDTKMDGQIQTYYSRKNWSSVVLWNCDHEANKRFTIEDLNTWPGRDLHGFKWLNDEEIGELPKEWNHLVGIDEGIETAKLLHFTNGIPILKGWKPHPTDRYWNVEYDMCFGATT